MAVRLVRDILLEGAVLQREVYEDDWQHSDMKDMAYFYVYKLYDEIVNQKGNLK